MGGLWRCSFELGLRVESLHILHNGQTVFGTKVALYDRFLVFTEQNGREYSNPFHLPKVWRSNLYNVVRRPRPTRKELPSQGQEA